MRRLLAPLSRWLDRRIDARIVAADAIAAECETGDFRQTLARMSASRDHRLTFAGAVSDAPFEFARVAGGAAETLPAGHVALVEMAVAGMHDAATVQREGR